MDSLDPEQLGKKAYQRGLWGDYKGAVSILSKAITKYPFDERLYNDRSYYYYKLNDYASALNDAEFMLKLFPTCARAHFRKGEVLMALKRYEEAERSFRNLLKLLPNNEEASFYVLYSQISQLTKDRKHWVQDAKRALEFNNFNTKLAMSFLELKGKSTLRGFDKSEIYYSDDEEENISVVGRVKPNCNRMGDGDHRSNDNYDPHSDPTNPLQSNAIWVGNVTTNVTEQYLQSIFSKYGKVLSIIVNHTSSCAFVNYFHPDMATNAMRNFPETLLLKDNNFVIRFPESSSKPRNIHSSRASKSAKKKKT